MAASNTEENYLKIVSTSLPRAYIKCIICIELCCSSKFSETWFSLRLMKLVIPTESEISGFFFIQWLLISQPDHLRLLIYQSSEAKV